MVGSMLSPEIEARISEWLNGPIDPVTRDEILRLQREDPESLSDAFYTNLSFGTGGMRGLMGVGPNRMNLYTIQMATQGLANSLKTQKSLRAEHHVFIGYDSRNNSKEFALEAARVLAGNGIIAYLTCDIRPTPFVSFGVRQKECSAGVMITASHNPKEYNGYKVFWSDGGQVVSPHDKEIVSEVAKIESLDQVKIAPENSPLIEIIDPELDLEYLEAIRPLQIDPDENKAVGDQLKITYTPLHGTGLRLVPRALKSWGFTNISLVDHQSVPDGDFPTVKSPNPENLETLQMGIEQMENTLSDLLIATDPDADRVGVVVLHQDAAIPLNGNQIAAICLEYICSTLQEQGRLPKEGAAVTTIVTSDLLGKIAAKYKIAFYEVLTGFKYIGELIHKWENTSQEFLFGAEESYGYLIGTHSRDKDAVVISCLIAEIALKMKVAGATLIDFLEQIYRRYGLYYEKQKTLDFPPGRAGMETMKEMMEKLRTSPPKEIDGSKVTLIEDYTKGVRDLPRSNVLLYRLEDESKIVVRPSGTEPKLKIYAGVHAPYEDGMDSCKQRIERLLHATAHLLQ